MRSFAMAVTGNGRVHIEPTDPLFLHPSDHPGQALVTDVFTGEDSVRGNILMMTPLPSLSQIYSLLVQEERQRQVRQGSQFQMESASFNVTANSSLDSKTHSGKKVEGRKSQLFCEQFPLPSFRLKMKMRLWRSCTGGFLFFVFHTSSQRSNTPPHPTNPKAWNENFIATKIKK
uniref:Uncharacterized protein n=1 Tax=Opuntia streptacantha TaxID=393608 RepID=A0A7C9D7K9_OPUST